MTIQKICVLGAGLMGSGITQICAEAGYHVAMRDIDQRFIDNGMKSIIENISRDVEKGRKSQEEMDAILGRITQTIDLKGAATDADIVVEVVVEKLDVIHSVLYYCA